MTGTEHFANDPNLNIAAVDRREVIGEDIFTGFMRFEENLKEAQKTLTISYTKIESPIDDHHDDKPRSLILVAKEPKQFNIWRDGIQYLMGKCKPGEQACKHGKNAKYCMEDPNNQSEEFRKDLEFLLEISMQMNLLNPGDAMDYSKGLPRIPPPPPDYDFVDYKPCLEKKIIVKKKQQI